MVFLVALLQGRLRLERQQDMLKTVLYYDIFILTLFYFIDNSIYTWIVL